MARPASRNGHRWLTCTPTCVICGLPTVRTRFTGWSSAATNLRFDPADRTGPAFLKGESGWGDHPAADPASRPRLEVRSLKSGASSVRSPSRSPTFGNSAGKPVAQAMRAVSFGADRLNAQPGRAAEVPTRLAPAQRRGFLAGTL